MSLSIPIEFCVVKSETVTPQGNYAYRKIISVKTTWDKVDELYAEYQSMCFNNIGYMTMLFTREPDETSIGDMAKELEVLKTALEQERKWKDQLAEDNRILREKLDIPALHFKHDKPESIYDGIEVIPGKQEYSERDISKWMDDNFSAETPETREHPFEYKDW